MPADRHSPFTINGARSITAEEHFGIKGAMLTTNVTYRDVLSVRGLWAPPYAATNFRIQVRLNGEVVPTAEYRWDGNLCERSGEVCGLEVSSTTSVPMQGRAATLRFTVRNGREEKMRVSVQIDLRGGAEYVRFWEFSGPGSSDEPLPWAEKTLAWAHGNSEGNLLLKPGPGAALAVATDLPGPTWRPLEGHWEAEVELAAGESRSFSLSAAVGAQENAAAQEALEAVAGGEATADAARCDWQGAVADVFAKLPRLQASDPRLERFYNRSLVHCLLNQWRVPELILTPYYSTGGINGGCVCCYLWDFGEPWEILALYDPEAVKRHILQFLAVDITHHFAFVPTTGEAFGPWYPVNQEKIIFLIYYYVLLTGDKAFLREQAGERTVIDWVLYHALYRDHPDLPVTLIDYGKGNNHLELRGNFRYDHHLPDLNGRRYANYHAADELARLAGVSAPDLPARAEALKALVKDLMWSPEHRWFSHLDGNYSPAQCYTVQMFKLLGSDVLDGEQVEGLISHLNECEFLSAFGLHSMSKLDPAYDQIDIDNGGGGNYTAFTPQIIERLYKLGRADVAEDLLQRILWWGERMPYWGDSIVANNVDYRRDTPLQNTIGALAGAQSILFGMFGVTVAADGSVTVNPQPPAFSPEISLTGLKVRGRELDILVAGGRYRVVADGEVLEAEVGVPVALPPR